MERVVPHSIEAEQALLGAFLINSDAVSMVVDLVRPEDFFEPIHGQMFKACVSLARDGRALTPTTLRPLLPEMQIGPLNMSAYLARLAGAATTVSNAPDYARMVAERAARRRLIMLAQEIEAEAYKVGDEAKTPAKIAEHALGQLVQADVGDGDVVVEEIDEIERGVIEGIQRAMQHGEAPGFELGMPFVDEITGPLKPGDLVVVGGRSGGGKTAFVMQALQNLSRRGGASAMYSLEMPGEQLAERGLASRANVSASNVAAATVNFGELERIVEAHRAASGRRIDIVRPRAGKMSMAMIEAQTAKLRARKNVQFIGIDHLQLIGGDQGRRYKDRFEIIEDAVFRAKLLANRLGIVVFLLSQLKRDDEQGEQFRSMNSVRRPRSEHLFGGDQITQAADKVLLIHRPITQLDRMFATGDEANGKLAQAREEWRDKAEILLDKRRNGRAPRRRTCRFLGETMQFLPLVEPGEDIPI